jgi:hypothetical protein
MDEGVHRRRTGGCASGDGYGVRGRTAAGVPGRIRPNGGPAEGGVPGPAVRCVRAPPGHPAGVLSGGAGHAGGA